MVSLVVFAIVIAALGLTVWLMALKKKRAGLAALRHDAEQLLWRRYNIVGDLIGYAANEGAPQTQALFERVVAARNAVMKLRGDPAARPGTEDDLQRALNAFYAAAYADDALMAEHDVVMILAHLIRADEKAFSACAGYDQAVKTFGRAGPLPLALTVAPAVAYTARPFGTGAPDA